MSFATILSRSQQGLEAALVRVEVHVGSGLPAFSIVGLPETVVKESKDRVRAALANCGFELPAGHITVNLAPADLPKEGGRFDLPIAVGILVASSQLPPGPFDADRTLWRALARRRAASDPRRAAHGAAGHARRAHDALSGRQPRRGCARAPRSRAGRGAPARSVRVRTRLADAALGRRAARQRRCRLPHPISPTCAGSRGRAARSRSLRPAGTACS